MPKIDMEKIRETSGSGYPAPFDAPCISRRKKAVGDAGGLTQFGAHQIILPPGGWSSQRHWHSAEDELVFIISGSPVLIDDDGRTQLSPGDYTAHKAGVTNGHHMINETSEDVVYLVIGMRNPQKDSGHYPDIDLAIPSNGTTQRNFTHKDGSPY